MNISIGKISIQENKPYIYIITKANYAYIGQTQKNPIKRWCNHLSDKDDFIGKLANEDPELATNENEPVNFYAYLCDEISENVDRNNIKRETEYIEGYLNVLFMKDERAFNYTLISNDFNTPIDSNIETITNNIAIHILENFLNEIDSTVYELHENYISF